MKGLISENLQSLIKYVEEKDGGSYTLSTLVKQVGTMSDDDVFKAYRAMQGARVARIILFFELQKRAHAQGVRCEDFFKSHGLKYNTEYVFCNREYKDMRFELSPKPIPDLSLPAATGDEDDTDREEVDTDELDAEDIPDSESSDTPEDTPEDTAAPATKKVCRCEKYRKTIEGLKEEIVGLKKAKADLKVWTKSLEKEVADLKKQIAARKDGVEVEAAHDRAATTKRRGTKNLANKFAVEVVARPLGDKFFVFDKNEVEVSSRTTRSSQFDTLVEAERLAIELNVKRGFMPKCGETEAAAV